MKTVIMAGGKGTRIAEINSDVPKPMIPIDGKPILEYEIEALSKQGCKDIIIIIGYLGNIISDYFGNGEKYGVNISYIKEDKPLGTAGALYFLKDEIKEDFLLVNGDIIFDVDINRFLKHHKKQGTMATILTHPNNHPYDSGIIFADKSGKVTNWLHKEDERLWYRNRVNAGLHMLSPDIFKLFDVLQKRDLDRDILKQLIPIGQLSIYDSPEYIKDMGTPERYHMVIDDIREGKVSAKNLSNKQRAIFLDRDGTINKYVGFLRNIDEFELIDKVSDAIKIINQKGYLAIVITNQPVIARGEVTESELEEIHNKMETLLGMDGAYIDGIFCCPHHPHKGYAGERPELKFDCDCRKPKAGLFFEAAEKFNIDLANSYMIGDSKSDMEAGINAGCRCIKIKSEEIKNNYDTKDIPCFDNLKDAVDFVFKN